MINSIVDFEIFRSFWNILSWILDHELAEVAFGSFENSDLIFEVPYLNRKFSVDFDGITRFGLSTFLGS